MSRTILIVRRTMTATVAALALLQLAGCNPYAPAIGATFSHIDEYKGTQTDEVPVILGGGTIRGLKLVREKANGQIRGHYVHVSVWSPENITVGSITFDGGDETIRLPGSFTLVDVDARSYGVFYKTFSVIWIRPEEIRRLAEFEDVLVTVSGAVDVGPVQIGPMGLKAIEVYRTTFVDTDGIGSTVTRASIRTSN